MPEKIVIGDAELWHGDCREVLPLLPVHDLMLTDPPYGISINSSHRLSTSRGHVGYAWDDKPVPHWLMLLLVDKANHLIVWGGNYYKLWPARCFLIWDKQNDGRDFADCELAWTNIDAVARIFRKRPMNMDGGKEHPTQKPIGLMTWCIDKAPNVKTVCDPFMGSGTTGVACMQLGRKFTGIERERRYFDIACERIAAAQAQGSLLLKEPEKPMQCGMTLV